ncbi:hypothetical protein C8R43DRAFT_1242194 [Mycena crocata]|nr:hypothetical protein C8R43DRAFT_1242194 [Mycena crocata]
MTTTCEKCGHRTSPEPDIALVSLPYNARYSNSSIPEQRAALAGIKSKIDQYRRMVYLLEREQGELEASLSLVVYPVLTLPIEIIARIFVDCLPEPGHRKPSPSEAPLLLAQVCHDWRQIALSTFKLWCSLDTGYCRLEDAGLTQLLPAWHLRAKGQLLSLTVRCWREAALQQVRSLMPSFSNQLRRLEFHRSSIEVCHLRPWPSFPNLEYLDVDCGGDDIQELISMSPCIRELHLLKFDLPSTLAIPSLQRLTIHGVISLETFIGILARFPLLSHIDSNVSPGSLDSSTPQVFPNLQSLTLLDEIPLKHLTLPNLHRLNLSAAEHKLRSVTSFLSRSSCVLECVDLCLDQREGEQQLLPRLLQAFSSVTTLNIEVEDLGGFLCCIDSRLLLLPKLERCKVKTLLRNVGIDYTSLIRILQHRRNPDNGATLKSFCIKLCDDDYRIVRGHSLPKWRPSDEPRTDLKWLIADGLDFSLYFEDCYRNVKFWLGEEEEQDSDESI